jgi:hypothetical protein
MQNETIENGMKSETVKFELPTRSSLEEALKLTDEINNAKALVETATNEVVALETRLRNLLGGIETVSAPSTPEHEEMRGRQGKMKVKIIDMLKRAGKRGVDIGEIATELGVKKENVSAWFAITGKKNPKIARIAPGRYSLTR